METVVRKVCWFSLKDSSLLTAWRLADDERLDESLQRESEFQSDIRCLSEVGVCSHFCRGAVGWVAVCLTM